MRIDRVVTTGEFNLDGGTWEVENNVWLIGDGREVLVIDPAHDAAAVAEAIGDRSVRAIVCTHGHDDHLGAVGDLRDRAPVWLHPADRQLWDRVYPEAGPDRELADGELLTVGGIALRVLHTPGHSRGGCCLYAPELGAVFGGDTLFAGGPGATGRSFSDFDTIIASIRDRLLVLPPETVVHPGHGDTTTIGTEAPHLSEWIERGW